MQDWRQWIAGEGEPARSAWVELGATVGRWLRAETAPSFQPFVDHLRRGHGDEVAAVLLYGSCLFSQTRTETSFPDFYVLVSDPARYYPSAWHHLLGTVLPPNVYYGAFSDGNGRDPLRCKYCVLSLEQFVHETSPEASDIHHLGRFSKRTALLYARDEGVTHTVVEGGLSAMLTLLPHTLAQLPRELDLEQIVLEQLGLSYVGEQRILEPAKAAGLLAAGRSFYLEVYPAVLALHALRFGTPVPLGGSRYRQDAADPRQGRRTARFLERSRMRGVLRWPKYVATVDNWVQYLLDKIERHHGVKVELTERQRRHPLIFGWPVYFEMRRRGLVR